MSYRVCGYAKASEIAKQTDEQGRSILDVADQQTDLGRERPQASTDLKRGVRSRERERLFSLQQESLHPDDRGVQACGVAVSQW